MLIAIPLQALSLLHFDMDKMELELPEEDAPRYLSIFKFLPGDVNDLHPMNMEELKRHPPNAEDQQEDDDEEENEPDDAQEGWLIEMENMNVPMQMTWRTRLAESGWCVGLLGTFLNPRLVCLHM